MQSILDSWKSELLEIEAILFIGQEIWYNLGKEILISSVSHIPYCLSQQKLPERQWEHGTDQNIIARPINIHCNLI